MSAPGNEDQHYDDSLKYQPIDLIEDRLLSFVEGNIVKYISRWKKKNGVKDLERVIWYATRLLENPVPYNTQCASDIKINSLDYIYHLNLRHIEGRVVELILNRKPSNNKKCLNEIIYLTEKLIGYRTLPSSEENVDSPKEDAKFEYP